MSGVENKSNVKHDSGVRLGLLQIQALQWIEPDATDALSSAHQCPSEQRLALPLDAATASLSSQFEHALLRH